MDGYAIRAADVAGAAEDGPTRLDVIGEVRAGQAPDTTVRRGSAVRIATGAPVPPGADAVVPVEQTTPVGSDGVPAGPRGRDDGSLPAGILVHAATPVGGSIRRAGSDLAAGTTIITPGTILTPALVGCSPAWASTSSASTAARSSASSRPATRSASPVALWVRPGSRTPTGPRSSPSSRPPAVDPRVLGIAADRFDDVRAHLCAGDDRRP